MGKAATTLHQNRPLDLANEVRNFVNREAREIARGYRLHRGAFDTSQERVANILKRTVRARTRDGWLLPVAWFLDERERDRIGVPAYGSVVMPGHPFREIPSRPRPSKRDRHFDSSGILLKGNSPILVFTPSLREALEAVPGNQVLEVFESEDIEKICQELGFLHELAQRQGPAFTLPELAETITAFIEYLRCQNESGRLLETGEPSEVFHPCPWLYQRLGRLYFDHPDFDDEPPGATERSKILELKIEVLGMLKAALENQRPDGLLDACLEAIQRKLKWAEVDWFFRQDRRYIVLSLRKKPKDGSELFHSGGLTDLIELMGYCLKELTIGVMAKTVDALIRSGILPVGENEITEADYFEVPLAQRTRFTEILDQCRELHDEEILGPTGPPKRHEMIEAYGGLLQMRKELPPKSLWEIFTEQVNSELIENRIQKILLELNQGPRKLTAKVIHFECVRQSWLHMKDTPYKFRRTRNAWVIGYQGYEFELRDSVASPGLNCIAYLIESQGRETGVQATDLYEKFSTERKTSKSHPKYQERAQRTVYKNITEAIEVIEKHHEYLGEYLRKEIIGDNGRTTETWYYLPQHRISWSVQPLRAVG